MYIKPNATLKITKHAHIYSMFRKKNTPFRFTLYLKELDSVDVKAVRLHHRKSRMVYLSGASLPRLNVYDI